MRNYYSDYVGHMMRQYIKLRENPAEELSETTTINMDICETALKRLPDIERRLLESVYSSGKNLKEGIAVTVEETGLRERTLWAIVKNFEKEVADERGLT